MVELTEFIINLGADKALNLDGGGSTTLVVSSNSQAKLLNSSTHTLVPLREGSIANYLGFYQHNVGLIPTVINVCYK